MDHPECEQPLAPLDRESVLATIPPTGTMVGANRPGRGARNGGELWAISGLDGEVSARNFGSRTGDFPHGSLPCTPSRQRIAWAVPGLPEGLHDLKQWLQVDAVDDCDCSACHGFQRP